MKKKKEKQPDDIILDEELGSSDRYLKKSNRTIMIFGIIMMGLFFMGLIIISVQQSNRKKETDKSLNLNQEGLEIALPGFYAEEAEIPFAGGERSNEPPITYEPKILDFRTGGTQGVLIGTKSEVVLTLGTNGRSVIRILKVELAEPPAEGLTFENKCKPSVPLEAANTCHITAKWQPLVGGNAQNNFVITWRIEGQGHTQDMQVTVPIQGQAIDTSMCGICDEVKGKGLQDRVAVNAGGLLGFVEGDKVFNKDKENIGTVRDDGMIIDPKGKPIGVAESERMFFDPNTGQYKKFSSDLINPNSEDIKMNILPGGEVISIGENDEIKIEGILKRKDLTGSMAIGFNSCRPEGIVMKDGTVKSEEKTIGVVKDFLVLDAKGNVAGSVVPKESIAVDFKGEIIGTVQSDAKIKDQNGAIKGEVMPDGEVIDNKNKIIGGVIKKSIIIGYECGIKAFVNSEGKVANAKGNIGKILPNGMAVSDTGEIIGTLVPEGLPVDEAGNVIGRIVEDGRVLSGDGLLLGCVNPDYDILDSGGNYVGFVVPEYADVMSLEGAFLGRFVNGKAVDSSGNVVGIALKNNLIKDTKSANIIGYIPENGYVVSDKGEWLGNVQNQSSVRRFCKNEPLIPLLGGLVVDKNANVKGNIIPKYAEAANAYGEIVARVQIDSKLYDNDGNFFSEIYNSKSTFVNDEPIKILPKGNVISNEGEILGKAIIGGNVINSFGEIIASVLPQGSVLNEEGDIVGAVVPFGMAVANNNEYLGLVNEKGDVINDNIKAKIRPNKDLLDVKGDLLGKAIDFSPVINIEGKDIGRTVIKAQAVDKNNNSLGNVNNEGIVQDLKSFIMPYGEVADFKGNIEGIVLASGKILRKNKLIDGYILPDNLALNDNGVPIGKISKYGIIVDNNAKVIGINLINGKVINRFGEIIASMFPDGSAVDAKGKVIGNLIEIGAFVIDDKGNLLGRVSFDATVVDKNNNKIGMVRSDGSFINKDGIIQGKVKTEVK